MSLVRQPCQMNYFEDLLTANKAKINLGQLFSIVSLNIYFKKKTAKLQELSIIDKIFNYCVLAFTGNILIGNMHDLT